MNDQHELEMAIRSRFPILIVATLEERRVVDLLRRTCQANGWALHVWDVVDGLERRGERSEKIDGTADPDRLLRHLLDTSHEGIYVLLDFVPHLDEHATRLRMMKRIAQEHAVSARTLVLVGHEIALPADLRRHSARFELAMPDVNRIRTLLREELDRWQADAGEANGVTREAAELIVRHLAGLCEEDVRRLIRQSLRNDGSITLADLERIQRTKHEMLGGSGLLTIGFDTGRMAEIGGLNALKRWLALRRAAFVGEADLEQLEVPKGILLLGVQGAGKSLAAKCVAGAWRLPLLRLDVGVLYNKYFGETERNLREALAAADAMSPCVLWIDEIEKGLASAAGSHDGGVSRRVLGTLLTWMAERQSRVFIVATANDIDALPPELIRKGRFDEIFFVDLPDEATRREIFEIHLARRALAAEAFDLEALAASSAGFSGAEIEQAIVAGLYEAHAESVPLESTHIQRELGATRPLSFVMAEKMAALRAWATDRAVPAG